MTAPDEHPLTLPLVSIITATWNAAESIDACLQSVRNQNYPRLEHLVIDGGSTDATMKIVSAFASPNLRWVSEPDQGIYDAWNKGVALAQGEWIGFLGADDSYLPGAIAAYMDLAQSNPSAEYLSAQVRWSRPNGTSRIIGKPWDWKLFRHYMCTAHVGSLHRRSYFDQHGKYDTSLRIVADYEMLLRAGSGLHAAYMPRITATMLSGGASDSVASIHETATIKQRSGVLGKTSILVGKWVAMGLHFLQRYRHRSKAD